jgi:hypothetical protein
MDIRLFFGMKYGTSSNIQLEHVQVQGNLREHIISVIDGKDSCVGKTWNLEFKPIRIYRPSMELDIHQLEG